MELLTVSATRYSHRWYSLGSDEWVDLRQGIVRVSTNQDGAG